MEREFEVLVCSLVMLINSTGQSNHRIHPNTY